MTAYVKPELEVIALRTEERVATCTTQLDKTGPDDDVCNHPECWTPTVIES